MIRWVDISQKMVDISYMSYLISCPKCPSIFSRVLCLCLISSKVSARGQPSCIDTFGLAIPWRTRDMITSSQTGSFCFAISALSKNRIASSFRCLKIPFYLITNSGRLTTVLRSWPLWSMITRNEIVSYLPVRNYGVVRMFHEKSPSNLQHWSQGVALSLGTASHHIRFIARATTAVSLAGKLFCKPYVIKGRLKSDALPWCGYMLIPSYRFQALVDSHSIRSRRVWGDRGNQVFLLWYSLGTPKSFIRVTKISLFRNNPSIMTLAQSTCFTGRLRCICILQLLHATFGALWL